MIKLSSNLIIVTLIVTILCTALTVAYAQSQTYVLTQIKVVTCKGSHVETIALPLNTSSTWITLCDLPSGQVTVMLPSDSSYGIEKVLEVLTNGGTVEPVVKVYNLRAVSLKVSSNVACLRVEVGKVSVPRCYVPVLGMYRTYVINNEILNITPSEYPEMMLIGHKIATLIAYRICVLSVAPIRVIVYPSNFTLITYRGYMTTVNSSQIFTLFALCFTTFNKDVHVRVEGTAEVRVWAYYAVPRKCSTNITRVIAKLPETIFRTCSNVYICNRTYCGYSVVTRLGEPVYVSVGSLVFAKYLVDSALSDTIVLPSLPLIHISDIRFVDSRGKTLTMKDLEMIRLTLVGPMTVHASERACLVAGNYRIVYKIGNNIMRVGPVYVQEGSKVELPVTLLSVRVERGGICVNGTCQVVLKVCNVRLPVNNGTHIIVPVTCNLGDVTAHVVVKNVTIPVGIRLNDGELLVYACVRPVLFSVRDYFGQLHTSIVVDGHLHCSSGSVCLVPCGVHTVTIDLGYGEMSYIVDFPPGERTKVVSLLVLSQRFVEFLTVTSLMIVLAISLSLIRRSLRRGRSKKVRRRKSEEDIIEIS